MQSGRTNSLLSPFGGHLLLVLAGLLFLASFYYQLNSGGTAAFIPNTWTTWSAAVIVITGGLILLSRSETIVLPRFWIGLIALPNGLLVAGLVTEITRPVEWALRIGYVMGGFLFLFSLFQYRPNRRSIEGLLFLLVLGSLGHAIAALIHVYGGTWWHGWLPDIKGVPFGIFQQVNNVASFSATGLVGAIYLATVPGYDSRSFLYKLLLHSTILLCAAVILATGSRAGLLGFILGVSLLVAGRYRILVRRKRAIVLIAAVLLVGVAYGLHLSDGVSKMQDKFGRSGYEDIRVAVYEVSWDLFREKPLFGHGLGRFQQVFQEAMIPFQEKHPDAIKNTKLFSHPHNEPLFWLIEGGLVAVFGMLTMALVTIRQLLYLGRERGLAYLALITPISLHVMVELPFYLSSIHWFAWLILLFLIHTHSTKNYQNRMSQFTRHSLPAISSILALSLVVFFMSTLQSLKGFREFSIAGDVEKFMKVVRNPVLSERGTGVMLKRFLDIDILTGAKEHTGSYIDWAETYTAEVPHPLVMAELALAYAHLNDMENARRVIDRALAIYNANTYLQECKREIEAGTFIEYYKRQLVTGKEAG